MAEERKDHPAPSETQTLSIENPSKMKSNSQQHCLTDLLEFKELWQRFKLFTSPLWLSQNSGAATQEFCLTDCVMVRLADKTALQYYSVALVLIQHRGEDEPLPLRDFHWPDHVCLLGWVWFARCVKKGQHTRSRAPHGFRQQREVFSPA